jgi:hypothetical protein
MTAATLAFLGTPGYIRDPQRFDNETLLEKTLGRNSGNLLFQYSASNMIDGATKHISLAELPYNTPNLLEGVKYLICPMANMLRLGADWTGLSNFLEGANRPLIILGLGAQSPKIGGERETIEALKKNVHIRRLCDVISERAVMVTVRGKFSQLVCDELGIQKTIPLGCPSAMINPNINLGKNIEEKIKAISANGLSGHFGMTAAAPFEIAPDAEKKGIERTIFSWLFDNNGLYFQQSGGVVSMLASNGSWNDVTESARKSIAATIAPDRDIEDFGAFMRTRGRFFSSAPAWIDEAKKLEFTLGTRLHGNMATIAAGLPGIIVTHDSRTGELADTMHLPMLSMEAVMKSSSVEECLKHVVFSGEAFDNWRARTACAYDDAFNEIGVTLKSHVKAIGQSLN